ncbi:MAG: CHASE3 domain-containing protein [Acidobacteria bacterium]|nr:CHASE3 domain-containing protein [Acidobacteriota bacterium]
MEWKIPKKTSAGFVLAFAVLVGICLISYRATSYLIETSHKVSQNYQLLGELAATLSFVVDAETSQRGFLLTGDKEFLEPYEAALRNLPMHAQQLRELSSHNPGYRNLISSLEQAILQKLQHTAEVIRLREANEIEAARAVVASGKGMRLMDNIREIIAKIEQEETASLQLQINESEADARNALLAVFTLSGLIFGLFLFSGYIFLHDIAELERSEEALKKASAAAEAANRAKSEFLATMSHEIRTPLWGMLGMTALVLDTPLTSQQREYLSLAKSSANSLLNVINDILDFSKIEAGRLDFESVEFRLRESLEDVMKGFAMRARQQGLELTFNVLPDVPEVLIGDPGRLRQVITNLVGNAVKFTERGTIALHVEKKSQEESIVCLHFSVADTGIGIAQEKQELIFDAFSQGDGSTTRKYGGTGLGLAISERLVKLMGGNIWVESDPGRGSTFHFTASFGLGKHRGVFDEISSRTEALPSRPERSRRFHILLAEDNPVNQRVAVGMLERRGHKVTAVANGREALAALDQQRFDIVLMDIQMPEMDGLATTAAIREREKATGGHVPIIALTSYAMKGDRDRCLAAGMEAISRNRSNLRNCSP